MIARIIKGTKSIDWVVWVGLIATALSVILYFLVNGFQSKDIPSWIQAVGSIDAILASIWIVKQNERRLTRVRVQRFDLIMNAALAYAKNINELSEAISEKRATDDSAEMQGIIRFWSGHELEQIKKTIENFLDNHAEEEVEIMASLRIISEFSKMAISIESLDRTIKEKNEILKGPGSVEELNKKEGEILQRASEIFNNSKLILFFRPFLGTEKRDGAYEALKVHRTRAKY